MRQGRTKRLILLGALALVMAGGGVAVARGGVTRLGGPVVRPHSDHSLVMVELYEQPTAAAYAQVAARSGAQAKASANAAAVAQLGSVRAEQARFLSALAQAKMPQAREVFRLQRAYNGVAIDVPTSQVKALAALPGVKAVHLLPLRTLDNAHSIPFIGVPGIWEDLGLQLHGESIKVGVIDTGIDYFHKNLGGTGDYTPNLSGEVIENDALGDPTFPTMKVVGGWDFAGTDYNPLDPAHAVPVPDPDPMDYFGHGSHVAGTIAGFGVTDTGDTYAGPYDATIDYGAIRIGPGVAPKAELYALKVFADNPVVTGLSTAAVEWAMDPNGDGSFDDHLDVVNLSLGGAHGFAFEPEDVVYRNATAVGVVVVAAAGNEGDEYFVTGSPGSVAEVVSVAAINDDYIPFAGRLRAVPASGPLSDYAVLPADFGPAFVPSPGPTGLLGLATSTTPDGTAYDACSPLDVDLTGQIAVIFDAHSCYFTQKVLNAQKAGAIAAVVVTPDGMVPIVMGFWDPGEPIIIPSGMVWYADGYALAVAAMGGTTTGELTNDLSVISSLGDTMTSFSSRGPSRDGADVLLKPDVAAPGAYIFSTAAGTGDQGELMSGTSMATPHIAGVMALLKQFHLADPAWGTAELKALLMNTANHDISPPLVGTQVGPGRVGAGRVDVPQALGSTVIAYNHDAPAAVSVSFHTKEVTAVTSETQQIDVRNMDATLDMAYDVTYQPVAEMPGTTITLGASTVSVAANATASLEVTLDADPAAMLRAGDPSVDPASRYWMSEVSGYVVFTPQGTTSAPVLRVPVYAAIRPASDMHATGSFDTSGGTGGVGTADVTLAGTGVATEAQPGGFQSLVTPFQLAYRSPDEPPLGMPSLPPGTDQALTNNADIKAVGVTSDYPLFGDVPTTWAVFGIETHGLWGSPAEVEFDIYVKRASAPDFQYMIHNLSMGGDQQVWGFTDLSTGTDLDDYYWLNVLGPDTYTPTFMADAVVAPLPVGYLGLSDADSEIEFVVVSSWADSGVPVDMTPLLRFDVARPGLGFGFGDYVIPGWGIPYLSTADMPDATVSVNFDLDAAFAQRTGGVLLLHHHNGAGMRGEIVGVDGLTCTVDADCPASRETRVCDPYQGACVGCLDASVCLPGELCDQFLRSCQVDCRDPGANPCSPGNYCDQATGQCVPDCRWPEALPCLAGSYCSQASGLCVVANALVVTTPVDPGAECPTGGVMIETGIDDNGDMVLDPAEVDSTSYVCNGLRTIVDVTDAAAGEGGCAAGGKLVAMGVDDNGDGVLQEAERDQVFYVCNGNDGHVSLVNVTTEEPGANCAAGGKKVETGIDDDGNGTLESAEVDNTTYICNGADGANGKQALATVTDEPAGENCATGGKKVETGIDANGDGILQAEEVDDTAYVCNGADGADGATGGDGHSSLVETTALSPGSDCAAGGVLVKTGLDTNGNGVLDPDEVTSVTAVCKGEKGSGGCAAAPTATGATPAAVLLLLGLLLLRKR